jgi:hypothetical protein
MRLGLRMAKGLVGKDGDRIVTARADGPFTSIEAPCRRASGRPDAPTSCRYRSRVAEDVFVCRLYRAFGPPGLPPVAAFLHVFSEGPPWRG